MEEKLKTIPLEKLRPDKELVMELAGAHRKWLRYLIIVETGIAVLNTAMLMAGAVVYGKKTIEILHKKVEEVS